MQHWVLLPILGIALFAFFAAFVRHRLLTALPTSKLSTAAAGYRELQGVAQASPDGALLDPIQNRTCVWFRVETYRQEERVSRDSRTGRETVRKVWEKIDEAESSRAFVLDDGSGRCLLAPAGAKIEVPSSRVTVGGGLFGGGLRHDITRIQPGERLFVIGHLSSVGDAFRLEKPVDGSLFLITRKSEQQMLRTSKYVQIAAGSVAIVCMLALFSALITPSPSEVRAAMADARRVPATPEASLAARRPVARSDDLLVERPKPSSTLTEAERQEIHRRRRWIEQLRARQSYAGLDTAPPMLSVTDRGATVVVTNNANRALTLHLDRLPDWANPNSRLCTLRAPSSAADGSTVLKSKEKITFDLPPDCSIRGSLDYRIGSHADLDSSDTIGWWSMSAIEREEEVIARTVGF